MGLRQRELCPKSRCFVVGLSARRLRWEIITPVETGLE